MRIAWFDCYAGISGDMCLGALVDAGVPVAQIAERLSLLKVGGYRLESKKVLRNGISATKVDVVLAPDHAGHHPGEDKAARRWGDIKSVIESSPLSPEVKQKGLAVFRRIFEAEGRVHGADFDKVHLHELGAVDCLVDVFGTIIGLEILGIEKIYCSPVNVGGGAVSTAHGTLPVPAPATLELLRGYPIYSLSADFELTTPTGAAILSGLTALPSAMPSMRYETAGYGAGNKDAQGFSNTLRIVIGTAQDRDASNDFSETVSVIETNIDDMNPQVFDTVMERLFAAGALDVYIENIVMKKGRPAFKLSVIAAQADVDRLCGLILKETTTIGVRFHTVQRRTLHREIRTVETEFGRVDFKIAWLDDQTLKAAPEYDHLRAIADATGIPLHELMMRMANYPAVLKDTDQKP